MWELHVAGTKIGAGAVQPDADGLPTVYGSHIAPPYRGQGWYSAAVLPALAHRFGAIWSGPCNAPSAGRAWQRTNARYIGGRWCLQGWRVISDSDY